MSNHTRRARLWGAAGVVLLIAAVIALITGFRAQQHAPQPPAAARVRSMSRPAHRALSDLRRRRPRRQHLRPLLLRSARYFPLRCQRLSTSRRSGCTPHSGTSASPPRERSGRRPWTATHTRTGWTFPPSPANSGRPRSSGTSTQPPTGRRCFSGSGRFGSATLSRSAVPTASSLFSRSNESSFIRRLSSPPRPVRNLDHAGLRLITCGGVFNAAQRSYESNIVVFASLVSTHPA